MGAGSHENVQGGAAEEDSSRGLDSKKGELLSGARDNMEILVQHTLYALGRSILSRMAP